MQHWWGKCKKYKEKNAQNENWVTDARNLHWSIVMLCLIYPVCTIEFLVSSTFRPNGVVEVIVILCLSIQMNCLYRFTSYFSHPTSSSLSTLPNTSFSRPSRYSSIAVKRCGIPAPRMRTASKPAFIPPLIATVATGIPRCPAIRRNEQPPVNTLAQKRGVLPASARYYATNPPHPTHSP